MVVHKSEDIVWQPVLGKDGVLYGIALDSDFAKRCLAVTFSEEELRKFHDHLWQYAKPSNWLKDYVPSDVFDWRDNTLLIKAIYCRHAGSGKWLNADTKDIRRDSVLMYSYHHSEASSMSYNLWLQFAFDAWAMFAQQKLKDLV